MSISPNMVAVGVALVGYACSRVLQHQCHTTGAGSTRRDSTGSSTAGSLYESRDGVLRDNKSAWKLLCRGVRNVPRRIEWLSSNAK